MGCGSRSEHLASAMRQANQHDPGVTLVSIALDEILGHQTVHQAGESARREHDALGELAHPQAATGPSSQTQQDVVVPEGDSVRCAKLGIEPARHPMMGVKECLPGSKLSLGELVVHGQSLAENYLRLQVPP